MGRAREKAGSGTEEEGGEGRKVEEGGRWKTGGRPKRGEEGWGEDRKVEGRRKV